VCDLNYVELPSTKVKYYIKNANKEGNVTLKRLKVLTGHIQAPDRMIG
jgi:hypothetical protein